MEELELTYLIKELPHGFENALSKEMLDIYIPASAEHAFLRIRASGDRYEITKKEPVECTDLSRQIETTIPLTLAEYTDLAQLPGKRIEKTRFYLKENNVEYEIDVFKGDLVGLVLVDVEFDALEKKAAFTPPAWCLADVTQEKFIAGGVLCGKKYADIENALNTFNYKKLNAL